MIVTKEVGFDMGHRVPNHKSKCSNVHGHRYTAYISLEGDIIDKVGSDEGMVIDFGDIKTISKNFIDKYLDHGYMYWEDDIVGQDISKAYNSQGEKMKTLSVPFIPTAENISKWLFEQLEPLFVDVYKTDLKLKQIKLYETPTSFVIYNK